MEVGNIMFLVVQSLALLFSLIAIICTTISLFRENGEGVSKDHKMLKVGLISLEMVFILWIVYWIVVVVVGYTPM